MPNLNIPEEQKRNMRQQPLSPFKRQAMAGGGSKMLPIMVIFSLIILVGIVIYALNQYGYINLWGEKQTKTIVIPEQEEQITEPATELSITQPTEEEQPMPETKSANIPKTETPVTKPPAPKSEPAKQEVKKEADKKVNIETGTGSYTIVVASFKEKANAEKGSKHWTDAGYEAMITEKTTGKNGVKWYRLSIGRYETKQDAIIAAAKLADALEAGYWIEQVK